jgi:hypothetical protein
MYDCGIVGGGGGCREACEEGGQEGDNLKGFGIHFVGLGG